MRQLLSAVRLQSSVRAVAEEIVEAAHLAVRVQAVRAPFGLWHSFNRIQPSSSSFVCSHGAATICTWCLLDAPFWHLLRTSPDPDLCWNCVRCSWARRTSRCRQWSLSMCPGCTISRCRSQTTTSRSGARRSQMTCNAVGQRLAGCDLSRCRETCRAADVQDCHAADRNSDEPPRVPINVH